MNILGWVAGDGRACAWAPAGMPLHAVFQPLVRAGSPSNSRLRCTHWLLLPRRVKAGVLPLCRGTAVPVAHLASAGVVATASSSASRAAGRSCEYVIVLSLLPE